MKSGRLLLSSSLLVCWFLNGCATQPGELPPASAPIIVTEEQPKAGTIELHTQSEQPTRRFSRETLDSERTTEIVGSSEQFDIALSNYVQQAKQSRDPQMAERATMI